MSETTANETTGSKIKTHKERYAVLVPIDSFRGIYRVHTAHNSSNIQEIEPMRKTFTPEKTCRILSTDISQIVFGLELGECFYSPVIVDSDNEVNILSDVYIYESLAGKQTFFGTVISFVEKQAQKNAPE